MSDATFQIQDMLIMAERKRKTSKSFHLAELKKIILYMQTLAYSSSKNVPDKESMVSRR